MKKTLYTILFVNCLVFTARAQDIGFQYSNSLKFLNAANDTIPYPFTGGYTAPQFNNIDLNGDGKLDLLVFDRMGFLVHPYLNIGNTGQIKFQYAPEYRSKFPRLLNWVRTFDYNNDGKMDLITNADPDIPMPGYFIQNNHIRVFKNTSTGSNLQFQLITPQLKCIYYFVDTFPLSVTQTDLPDMADMDGDGDMDIIGMSGLGAYIEYYKNYQVEQGLPVDSFKFYNVDRCWGSVLVTDRVRLGMSCDKTYFKTNAHNGTTLTLFDNDADGDMDLYSGDVLNDFMYYIKNGRKEFNWKYKGFAADTLISYDSLTPKNTTRAKFPSALAAYFVDLNNDGKKDLVIAPNGVEGIKTKDNIWLYQNTGTGAAAAFTFVKKNFLLDESIDIGWRFVPAILDYNQDGKKDLIVATGGDWEYTNDTKDQLVLFQNIGTNQQPVFKIQDTNYLSISNLNLSYIKPATGDVDGDGKPDIILGATDGTLTFLHNTTTGGGNMTFGSPELNFQNIQVNGISSPCIYDMNLDGKCDLLVGTDLGLIHYYRNIDTFTVGYKFLNVPVADTLGQILSKEKPGQYLGYASPFVYNYASDSMLEIMVGSFGGRVRSYRMQAGLESTFPEIDSILIGPGDLVYGNKILGSLSKCNPVVANFDSDTIPDMLVGIENGGVLFFKGYYRKTLPVLIGYDTVRLKIHVNTGVVEINEAGIVLFPNPVNDMLQIERSDKSIGLPFRVILYDVLGREINEIILQKDEKSLKINTKHLTPGLFFIKVFNGDKMLSSHKIIKE